MSYSTESVAKVGALKRLAEQLKAGMPVKVSQLTNDAGYQTKADVAAAIAALNHLARKKVESLDAIDLTAEDAAKYIYMVPNGAEDGSDKYDEYMVSDGALEHIGNTAVDLSGYATKEYVDSVVPAVATDEEIGEMLDEVFGTAQA